MTLHWYDGGMLPERPAELEENRELDPEDGIIFVGDKGKMLVTGWGGEHPRLIPESRDKEYKRPPKTLPRSIGHHQEWIEACKTGSATRSNFDFAGTLDRGRPAWERLRSQRWLETELGQREPEDYERPRRQQASPLRIPKGMELVSDKVRVGLIGSGFISTIHAEALKQVGDAELVAVASPSAGKAETLAGKYGIPHHFTDYRRLLGMEEISLVVIGVPNDLHCQVTLAAAAAGKHIVLEKPMGLNLAEADRMLAACQKAKVKLMYAEELCFTPKYVRLKQLLDSGALGQPALLKQSEKHDGPHAAGSGTDRSRAAA